MKRQRTLYLRSVCIGGVVLPIQRRRKKWGQWGWGEEEEERKRKDGMVGDRTDSPLGEEQVISARHF